MCCARSRLAGCSRRRMPSTVSIASSLPWGSVQRCATFSNVRKESARRIKGQRPAWLTCRDSIRLCAAPHPCPLHKQVPVPKAWCLCQDASVIGTPFYVMSFIGGRVYDDLALPEMQPADRYQVSAQCHDYILAELCSMKCAARKTADIRPMQIGLWGSLWDQPV